MAGSARRIVVEFLGDGKQLSGELNGLQSKTSKFGSILGKVGKAAVLGFAGAVAAGGVAAYKFGQAAGDLNETISKTTQIFGQDSSKALQDWGKNAAKSFGMSQQTALDAAATFGTFGKAAGKSGVELQHFAQQNTMLAADLASFNNTTPEEAIVALGAAFRGESEPLRAYGVLLDDASMRQEALSMGLIKTTKEALTPQQKVLSAQALIMKQTSDAQGDFERTSDGLANRQRILKAEFENIQVAIGQKVLPVMLTLATFTNDKVLPALGKLGTWLQAHVLPVLRDLGNWIETKVVPAIKKFVGEMRSGDGAGGQFVDVLGKMRDALQKVWGVLQPVLSFMANNKTVVATFAGVILTVVAAVKAWAIAQAALNIVLSANPIGLVVIAVAALAAGLVYAWKRSSDFREGVNTMWNLLKKFIGFTPLGALISNFGQIAGAIDTVISKVQSLVSWIGKLDLGKVGKIAGAIPGLGGLLSRGATGGRGGITNAGLNLIEDIVKGITKHKVKLDTVLDKLRDYIAKKMDKLQALLDKRQAILDTFRGFTSSIFSTDLSTGEGEAPKTIQALLDFQAQAKAKAQQLAASVKALINKGLSKDLLHQLMAAGEAGQDQINLLATGTAEQIQQANADNLATQMALQEAGLAASEALGIEQAIKQEERDIKLAETIKGKLDELLKQQDKNTVVQLKIGGHILHVTLLELKRKNGGRPLELA